MKKFKFLVLFSALLLIFCFLPFSAGAIEYNLRGGGTANVLGYMSQSAQFGLAGDKYDTETDLQSALMNIFIEGEYMPNDELKFYASGMLTMDWVYDLKHDDKTWEDKRFNESRDNFFIDDESWQLLKEAHVTWSPGDFVFRAGKQIVSWGEMDFIRVMDQINPTYDARGFADVEFETTVIPIWLMRADYWPDMGAVGGAFQDLGIQFIFNPNAQFIPYRGLTLRNEEGGIWAPNYILPTASVDPALIPVIGPEFRLGIESDIEDMDEWDSDNFEYGIKIRGTVGDHTFTLNGFYGRSNIPQEVFTGTLVKIDPGTGFPVMSFDSDGMVGLTFLSKGKYFRQKFVGLTYNYDLKFLRVPALGGVSPFLRFETMYEFDHTFVDDDANFGFAGYVESDYWKTGIAIDWKVKIPALNEKAYFTVMPQFFYNRVMDYKSAWALSDAGSGIEEDMYSLGFLIETAYLNARLKPSIAVIHDFNGEADYILPSLTWIRNYKWTYSLDALFVDDRESDLFDHKNYIGCKVTYNWG
jgi:hypothetical protein